MTSVAATQPTKADRSPPTAADRARAQENIKKAKVQLVIHQPFWANVVLRRPITMCDKTPTAYIDAKGHITMGTKFVAGLSVPQTVFLLAHEAGHYVFGHFLRRGARDPRRWNTAGDWVINDLLEESNVGEKIEGGAYRAGARTEFAEKLYDEIPEQDGKGGGGNYSPGEGWDDMDPLEGMSQDDIDQLKQDVAGELAQAAQAARTQGKLPASLATHIDNIVNPATPWYRLLHPFMIKLVKNSTTWARPNRRLLAHNLYLPSPGNKKTLGLVVIARDTSGSCMGKEDQESFLGHMNAILDMCQPERMVILDTDARVNKVHDLTPNDLPVRPASYGGGGTSFCPPFEWVAEQGLTPDVFIYLTDMYGDFPDQAPHYPTVWLSVSQIDKAPFGTVIMCDLKK